MPPQKGTNAIISIRGKELPNAMRVRYAVMIAVRRDIIET